MKEKKDKQSKRQNRRGNSSTYGKAQGENTALVPLLQRIHSRLCHFKLPTLGPATIHSGCPEGISSAAVEPWVLIRSLELHGRSAADRRTGGTIPLFFLTSNASYKGTLVFALQYF